MTQSVWKQIYYLPTADEKVIEIVPEIPGLNNKPSVVRLVRLDQWMVAYQLVVEDDVCDWKVCNLFDAYDNILTNAENIVSSLAIAAFAEYERDSYEGMLIELNFMQSVRKCWPDAQYNPIVGCKLAKVSYEFTNL